MIKKVFSFSQEKQKCDQNVKAENQVLPSKSPFISSSIQQEEFLTSLRKEIEKSKKNEKKSNDPFFDKNQPPRVNRMEISKDADYKLVFDKKMIIPDNMEQL